MGVNVNAIVMYMYFVCVCVSIGHTGGYGSAGLGLGPRFGNGGMKGPMQGRNVLLTVRKNVLIWLFCVLRLLELVITFSLFQAMALKLVCPVKLVHFVLWQT